MEKFTSHTGVGVPLRRSGTPTPVWVENFSIVSPFLRSIRR